MDSERVRSLNRESVAYTSDSGICTVGKFIKTRRTLEAWDAGIQINDERAPELRSRGLANAICIAQLESGKQCLWKHYTSTRQHLLARPEL